MALDLNIYEGVFQFLGVTNLSGDPVWDAVTKLLLPMVVLFLFIRKVIGDSRFVGTGTELILSFITGFIIIYQGYFAIFADLSIYLLGIIILWHTLSFVFGSMGGKSGGKKDGEVTQPSSEGEGGGGVFGRVQDLKNIEQQMRVSAEQISQITTRNEHFAKEILEDLEKKFKASEKSIEDAQKKGDRGSGDRITAEEGREARMAADAEAVMQKYKLTREQMWRMAPNLSLRLKIPKK